MMSFKLIWCVEIILLKTVNNKKKLGVTIDNKLNFATHLLNIAKNANIKFNPLARVQKYMTTDKKYVYSPHLSNRNLLIAF